jgi:outer membrane biosynthesis protein TonB
LGAEDLAADSEKASAKLETHLAESKPLSDDDEEEEKSVVTNAKSEIELPSPTPKPTATPESKPSATPTPKPKVTPKPSPKPTPKKILLTKATAKSSSKPKTSPASSSEHSEKPEKKPLTKNKSESQSGSGKTGSTSKAGTAGGGDSTSEFGWYGHMLHDRFYSAWIQPTSSVPSGTKISTLVNARIEKDGRVSKFEIIKPSENVVLNESVAAIPKRITEVDAPPTGLLKGDHYDVKINFELNTEKEASK